MYVCGHVRVGVDVSVCVCVKEKREGEKKNLVVSKEKKVLKGPLLIQTYLADLNYCPSLDFFPASFEIG